MEMTRKRLKAEYHEACVERQELLRSLSKDEGKCGFAIWSDARMRTMNEKCERLGKEWREWKDPIEPIA